MTIDQWKERYERCHEYHAHDMEVFARIVNADNDQDVRQLALDALTWHPSHSDTPEAQGEATEAK